MTFKEMLTVLQTDLDDAGDETWGLAEKKQKLNDAHQRLMIKAYEMGDFRLTSKLITTSAGVQEYDLDVDFYASRKVRDSDGFPLSYSREFNAAWNDLTGKPRAFYLAQSHEVSGATTTKPQIGFVPIPDSVYTFTVYGFPSPFILTGDGDVSGVAAPFHPLICLFAQCALLKKKGMWELYRAAKSERDEMLEDYLESMRSRQKPAQDEFYSAFETPEEGW